MIDTEILEGNKLIGEFMGYRMFDKRYPKNHGIGAPEAEWKDMIIQKARFHESWERLMPVVQKIAGTPMEDFIDEETEDGGYAYPITFGMRTEIGEWMVRFRGHAVHMGNTLIEAAWLACVDFITWYNKQS